MRISYLLCIIKKIPFKKYFLIYKVYVIYTFNFTHKKRHTLRCAFKQSAASYHTRPWQYSIHSFFMYGTLFWASSKVMCGPHASLRSSVASHPTLPTPSHRLLSIDNTCTTLAGDGSRRYQSCAR